MRRTLLAPLLLTLPLLTFACGGDENAPLWTVAVDTLPSGAVRVVNSPPESGIEPKWVIEEELRIGSLDEAGPSSFGQVKGLAVLDDGRIAVLDEQASQLRIFGPDGGHRATFGRKGAGPGEFEAAFGLMLSPEGELWVPDHANARMSVFDPDSGFVRSYPLTVLSRGFIWGGVMTSEGRVLKPSITLGEDRSYVLRVYDPEMNLTDSLRLPDYPPVDEEDPPHLYTYGSREAGRWGMVGVPYYPHNRRLLDPAGVFWSTALGDPSYRVTQWRPGSLDTTLVLETRRPPVAVTAAERDSALAPIAERLSQFGDPGPDPGKVPAVKPAIHSMFIGEDGRLWVRTPTADSLITFDVYERDGRYVGTAVTRLDLYPWLAPVVRGDRFWALVTDEMDVQYVVRARLRPAEERTEEVSAAGAARSAVP